MGDRLLTTKEVAHLLSVTTSWLSQAAATGEVPAYRIARGWRYDVDELGLWLTLRGNDAVERPDSPRRSILPPPRPGRVNPPPEPIVDLANALPAEDVAAELDVPLQAVRRWITEAILPGAHVGRSWLVDAVASAEWRKILGRSEHLKGIPAGRDRTAAVRSLVISNLLHRMGIRGYSLESWTRRGGGCCRRGQKQWSTGVAELAHVVVSRVVATVPRSYERATVKRCVADRVPGRAQPLATVPARGLDRGLGIL